MNISSSNALRKKRSRGLAAWLLFALIAPVVGWLSVSYSRDYSIYLDLIANRETTDLLLEAYIAAGMSVGASANGIYLLFLTSLIGLAIYYFTSRHVSCYWISVYLLSFGLLHMVTQVRAGMASIVIALLLTSKRKWMRILTPVGVAIHASAVLFIGSGMARKRSWLIVLCVLVPLAGLVLYGVDSEKLIQYAAEANESQAVSIALATYCVTLFVILFARLPRQMKIMLVTVGVLTIALYWIFLDLKAISNRFVELSHAVSLLLMGALDSRQSRSRMLRTPTISARPVVGVWLKLSLLAASLLLFYVSNIQNSILDL